jgi:hypothetical protein
MAKRDRDTNIWKDKFYQGLPPLYKCFWDYINDECDNAGVWITEFKTASNRIGRKIRPELALELFGARVQVFDHGNKWHVKTFVSEKLGFDELNPAHKFQKSILDLLNKHKIQKDGVYPDTLQSVKERTWEGKGQEKGRVEGGTGGTLGPKPLEDDLFEPLTDEWFAYIFDEMEVERKKMAYRDHDINDMLIKFKSKVRGSPDEYIYRDTAGVRAAFDYQLRNTKPQKKYAGAQRTLTETSPDPGKDYSEKF